MDDNSRVTLPRFYVPDLDPSRGEALLPLDESRHLTRVLRLGAGDEVAVFDGRGRAFRGRVSSGPGRAVRVALIEPLTPAPEARVPLTLATAVLKGDKMDDVVRDATMMGVAAIAPLLTGRTVVPRRAARAAADRWTRVAVASAKQCGRAVVPEVREPQAFGAWLVEDRSQMRLLLVEPSARDVHQPATTLRGLPPPASATVLAGPEGGWMPDEIAAALAAGCLPVTLGRRTLRADAVPVAALAILQFLWDDD